MAAPSGTTWGSIVTGSSSGRKGRLGVYTNISSTATETTVKVELWFWTIYSCLDGGDGYYNEVFYNVGTNTTSATTSVAESVHINHTVATGSGWSTSNQTKIYSATHKYTRDTSAKTYKIYAKFAGIDMLGAPVYVNTSFSVPALASYTIAYNANGGSGAPSSQTKWYGKDLTLSSTKPTRTGYSFQGWALTKADADAGTWYYAAGNNCGRNENLTLYAVWKPDTYTVSYNANGGSGAPASQTKTYGKTLVLSATKPTRMNYTFLGWATSKSAITATYPAGSNYTANNTVTLYAVWSLAYVKPSIYNFTVARCDSSGVEKDNGDGSYALVKFEWETTYDVTGITIQWTSSANSDLLPITASGKYGNVSQIIGNGTLATDVTYTVVVSVADNTDSTSVSNTLHGMVFAIDFLAGGRGVGFGKAAEIEGVVDFALDAKFNNPVYGNALGLNRLPEIPANSDFDDYMTTGCYAVYSNANAATIANIPVDRAGRLEVWSSTGEGIRLEQWSYLRQRYIPYNDANAVWERDITRSSDNVWTYGEWWRSTLTPAASAKTYHEQIILWEGTRYMTADHTINLSEAVSAQPNGIVLVFSKYANGAAVENNFNSFFVPKKFITTHFGYGNAFTMMDINFGLICHKYLYIDDTYITGHANNSATGTGASGITYANNAYVLRYVIGV